MNSRRVVTATTDMAVLLSEPEAWRSRVFLRQAQDRRSLRRTVQVRLGTNPAVPRDGCPRPWVRDERCSPRPGAHVR